MVPFCSERNPLVRVSTVHCSSVMRTERACAPCTLIGPHSARPGLFGLRILPLALSGSKRSRALRVLAWTTDSFTMRRRFVPSPRKTPRRRGYYNRKRLNVFGRSGGPKLVRTESERSALRSLLLLPGIPSPMKGSVSTRRPPWSRLSNAATLQRARFGCSLSRGFEVHVWFVTQRGCYSKSGCSHCTRARLCCVLDFGISSLEIIPSLPRAILENVMLIIVVAAPSLNVAARCAAPRMGFAPSPKELSNDPTIKETLAAAAVERAEREARARNIKSEALPFMVSFIDFRKSTARVQSPPVSDHLRGQSRYRSPTTILCERVRVRTGAPARPRRLDAR